SRILRRRIGESFFWPRDVHRNDFGADAVTGSIHGIVCRRRGLDCLLPAGYHRARQCRSRTLDFTHARRGAVGFGPAASILAQTANTKGRFAIGLVAQGRSTAQVPFTRKQALWY